MTTTLPMKRSLAVTVVNAYYEIKNEGNNQKNEEQFKKNFVKFIVPYMSNTYFTENYAERLFMDIITLEDDKFSVRDENLFLSAKNYHYLNGIKNKHFDQTKEMMDIMAVNDWVREEDDCYICGEHGYDINWPIIDDIGKFYYSIPGHINKPVCESCVKTNCFDIKSLNDDFAEAQDFAQAQDFAEAQDFAQAQDFAEAHDFAQAVEDTAAGSDDAENYGSLAYLRKHDLTKCENCGNIWDGYAQCNCWQWNDYDELANKIGPDEIDTNEIGPDEIYMDKIPEYLQEHNKEESGCERYHKNIDAMFASWKEEDKQQELYIRSPPPDRPVPLPMDKKIMGLEEKIALLEEEKKNLLEQISHLKHLVNNS